jgi:hypothetical protein
MTDDKDTLVYWLDPWAWDKEMELMPLDRSPQSVGEWLALIHQHGWEVMLLPYDARISGGPCDGGHVVAVETGGSRQFAALPPLAILSLQTVIPGADYQAILRATPALSALHGDQQTGEHADEH